MQKELGEGRHFLKANWERFGEFKSDQAKGMPVPLQEDPAPEGSSVVPLVPAEKFSVGGKPLREAMRERKSRRKFSADFLNLEELSFLAWSAEGVKEYKPKSSFRTVPSGGARHPLDLFVFISRVDDLEPGLYRYLPVEHSLVLVRGGDDSPALDAALLGQYWNAAVVFIWAAIPYRTEWRYHVVSHKIIALDAGHSCQNVYLACEALGCGTCAIGAYDQEKLDFYLGLDGNDRFAIYAAPIGRIQA
jgi:SagB-type dehydrogenase family enzyme